MLEILGRSTVGQLGLWKRQLGLVVFFVESWLRIPCIADMVLSSIDMVFYAAYMLGWLRDFNRDWIAGLFTDGMEREGWVKL